MSSVNGEADTDQSGGAKASQKRPGRGLVSGRGRHWTLGTRHQVRSQKFSLSQLLGALWALQELPQLQRAS